MSRYNTLIFAHERATKAYGKAEVGSPQWSKLHQEWCASGEALDHYVRDLEDKVRELETVEHPEAVQS